MTLLRSRRLDGEKNGLRLSAASDISIPWSWGTLVQVNVNLPQTTATMSTFYQVPAGKVALVIDPITGLASKDAWLQVTSYLGSGELLQVHLTTAGATPVQGAPPGQLPNTGNPGSYLTGTYQVSNAGVLAATDRLSLYTSNGYGQNVRMLVFEIPQWVADLYNIGRAMYLPPASAGTVTQTLVSNTRTDGRPLNANVWNLSGMASAQTAYCGVELYNEPVANSIAQFTYDTVFHQSGGSSYGGTAGSGTTWTMNYQTLLVPGRRLVYRHINSSTYQVGLVLANWGVR